MAIIKRGIINIAEPTRSVRSESRFTLNDESTAQPIQNITKLRIISRTISIRIFKNLIANSYISSEKSVIYLSEMLFISSVYSSLDLS